MHPSGVRSVHGSSPILLSRAARLQGFLARRSTGFLGLMTTLLLVTTLAFVLDKSFEHGTETRRPTPPPARAAACHGDDARYPRSATYYLSQERLPSVADLARFDIVVLDAEWAHRAPPGYFEELRHRDPGVCLLAYVDLVDKPQRLGSRRAWRYRYSLWRFTGPRASHFPRAWLARTGGNAVVSEYPGTEMANLSAVSPRVGGLTYGQYAARWIVHTVWTTGVWDGVFLDVWGDRLFGLSSGRWDVDGRGSDEPYTSIFGPGGPWARGLREVERLLRAGLGDALLIGNGERALTGSGLDGRAWESFTQPESGRSPTEGLREYVSGAAAAATRTSHGVSITIDERRQRRRSSAGAADLRFQLASTLMQDGYWAPMGRDYEHLAYYRSMGGAGLGRGYLGRPVSPSPTWSMLRQPFAAGIGSLGQGLLRRDFRMGIVLLNTAASPREAALPSDYRHPFCAWARCRFDVNNGFVTIPPHDALVILRQEPAQNPVSRYPAVD